MKKILITLFISVLYLTANSQIKISQLTEATSINTTDLFLLSKGDASRKLQFSTLKNSIFNPINYPLRVLYSGDSLRIGFSGDNAIYYTSQNYHVFNKPLYYNSSLIATVPQLSDTAMALRSLIGVTYANEGVYMDGDTVKYSGAVQDMGIEIRSQSTIYGNETGLSAIVEPNGYANTKIYAKGKLTSVNDASVAIDTTGMFYFELPDTTLTTPNHFLTEAQVKREIAASTSASLIDGVFKASGSTFDYYPDSVGTGSKGGLYKFNGTQWPSKETNYALNGAITAQRFFAKGFGSITPMSLTNDYTHSNNPLFSITNSGHNSKGITIQNYYDSFGSNQGIQVFNYGYAGIQIANNNIKDASNSGILIENNAGSTGIILSGDSTGNLISLTQTGTGDLINSSKFRIRNNGQVYYTGSSSHSSVYGYGDNDFDGSLIYLNNEGKLNSQGLHILNNPIGLNTISYGADINNINGYCGLRVNSQRNKNIDSYAILALSTTASDVIKIVSDSIGDILKIENNGTGAIINSNTDFDVTATGIVYHKGTYAGIYVNDGATPQNIPTGTTYTKMTHFATNGESSNCTADQANDKITITKTGRYYINWSTSFTTDLNNVLLRVTVFLNGVEQASPHAARKIGTGADVGSMSGGGFVNVTSVPYDLDLRCRHDNVGTVALTVLYSNLTVNYAGE